MVFLTCNNFSGVGYWPPLKNAITSRTRTPTILTVAHHLFAWGIHISTKPNTTYSADRRLKIHLFNYCLSVLYECHFTFFVLVCCEVFQHKYQPKIKHYSYIIKIFVYLYVILVIAYQ